MTQLAQVTKIVQALNVNAVSTATQNTDVIGMQLYNHLTYLVSVGSVTGDDAQMLLYECDDNVPTTNVAIPFNYREMVAPDTMGDIAASDAAGVTISAGDDNHMFVVEIDASELKNAGYPYTKLSVDPGGSMSDLEISIVAILSEARYLQDVPLTPLG